MTGFHFVRMTEEATATIEILDRIGQPWLPKYSKWQRGWQILVDPPSFHYVHIRYKSNSFFSSHTLPGHHGYSGWEMLEELAKVFPIVAKKLAEPIE